MKRVTYLRLAAVLPVLPLAASPLLRSQVDLGDAFGALVLAAIYGGIPYVVAGGISLYLLRGKPPASYWRLARWAPLIFAAVFGVAVTTFGLVVDPSASVGDFWVLPIATAFYALYVIPIGYFYVLLAWLGYALLDHLGLLQDAA
jgi:hypothetical protein